MLFRDKKRHQHQINYDPTTMFPAIRASICTGEQTAGFVNRETGVFTAVMLISSPVDRKRFCNDFGIRDEEIKTIY